MRSGRGSVSSADILIVDDDPIALEIHARLLRSQGHIIVVATSAQEALARIAESVPDLVVSDVMMPKIDGIELTRMLRGMCVMRDVPVLLVSVLEDRETRVRACELADEILNKPVDGLEFVLRINLLLRRRARVRELMAENDVLRAENDHLQRSLSLALDERHSLTSGTTPVELATGRVLINRR